MLAVQVHCMALQPRRCSCRCQICEAHCTHCRLLCCCRWTTSASPVPAIDVLAVLAVLHMPPRVSFIPFGHGTNNHAAAVGLD